MNQQNNEAPKITDVLEEKNQEKEQKEVESALAAGGGNTLAEDADKLDNLAETKEENIKAWEEKLGKKLTAGNQQEQTQTARQ